MDKTQYGADPTALDTTVELTAQPLRQGGPQRLDEVLRDLDLRPVTEVDGHAVDAETARAIQVLRDAGLEPEIIGIDETGPDGLARQIARLAARGPVFLKFLPVGDTPPLDVLSVDRQVDFSDGSGDGASDEGFVAEILGELTEFTEKARRAGLLTPVRTEPIE